MHIYVYFFFIVVYSACVYLTFHGYCVRVRERESRLCVCSNVVHFYVFIWNLCLVEWCRYRVKRLCVCLYVCFVTQCKVELGGMFMGGIAIFVGSKRCSELLSASVLHCSRCGHVVCYVCVCVLVLGKCGLIDPCNCYLCRGSYVVMMNVCVRR